MLPEDRKRFVDQLGKDLAFLEKKLTNALEVLHWKVPSEVENMHALQQCPFDSSHKVKPENFNRHIQNCKLQAIGFKTNSKDDEQAVPESTKFYYENIAYVTQVNVDLSTYHKLGCDLGKKKNTADPLLAKSKENAAKADIVKDSIVIDHKHVADRDLECQNDSTRSFDKPIDELRWIYSWSQVPKSYCKLDLTQLTPNEIKAYLIENLPQTYLSLRSDGDIKLMQFIYDCLHGNNVGPNVLVEHVKEILRDKTHGVVLSLWKFLASKILQKTHKFSKDDMEDAKRYGLCVMRASIAKQSEIASVSGENVNQNMSVSPIPLISTNKATDVPLPMEYVASQLIPEQRKRIYDFVIEETKSLRTVPSITYEDIEKDTETQLQAMAVEEERRNNAPRSHLEVMAELRDYKRRRQTYRGKGTELKRRTGTQVLKDVIDEQMKYLEIIHQKFHQNDVKKEEEPDPTGKDHDRKRSSKRSHHRDNGDESRSKKRRHSSRDRHSDRKHKKHKHKHERRRKRSRSADKESHDEETSQGKISDSRETDIVPSK